MTCTIKRIVLPFLLAVLGLLPGQGAAQTQVNRRFDNYARLLSPEKLYLHTDREVYNIGDTLWLRGYLENVAEQAEYPACNYLYVEIFSGKWERDRWMGTTDNKVRMRKRVKVKRDADEGAAWFASVALFGRKPLFIVSDADVMDERPASLQGNGIKRNSVALFYATEFR